MSEEQAENNASEIDYEAEAREQNWVSKEEFKGNPDDWVDAKTFVERGKQINPILRANNERLLKEVEKTRKQMEELRVAAEEFKKFQKEQYERRAAALTAEIAQLREEKKLAISSGDGARVVAIDEQIDTLKEQKSIEETKKDEKPVATQNLDPVLEDWVGKNYWYQSDVRMQAIADEEAKRINIQNPYLKGKEFLDELDKALDSIFSPEKLGRQKKVRSPVEGASPSASSTVSSRTKQSYDSLPPEAKEACDKFVKQKLMTKEEYVAEYYR